MLSPVDTVLAYYSAALLGCLSQRSLRFGSGGGAAAEKEIRSLFEALDERVCRVAVQLAQNHIVIDPHEHLGQLRGRIGCSQGALLLSLGNNGGGQLTDRRFVHCHLPFHQSHLAPHNLEEDRAIEPFVGFDMLAHFFEQTVNFLASTRVRGQLFLGLSGVLAQGCKRSPGCSVSSGSGYT